jgi:hypothetical protein
MYSSTHSLNSALDGGEWSASRPGRFTPRERAPGTHWVGGWVGSRAVLDAMVKRKIPSLRQESNQRTPIVQPVVQHYTDWAITAHLERNMYCCMLSPSVCLVIGKLSYFLLHEVMWNTVQYTELNSYAFPMDYNFVCCLIRMWNLAPRPSRRTQIAGTWEQKTEKHIWI